MNDEPLFIRIVGRLVFGLMAAVGYVILAPFALAAQLGALLTGRRIED